MKSLFGLFFLLSLIITNTYAQSIACHIGNKYGISQDLSPEHFTYEHDFKDGDFIVEIVPDLVARVVNYSYQEKNRASLIVGLVGKSTSSTWEPLVYTFGENEVRLEIKGSMLEKTAMLDLRDLPDRSFLQRSKKYEEEVNVAFDEKKQSSVYTNFRERYGSKLGIICKFI